MAIKITNLDKIAKEYEIKNHLYKDLHLDFSRNYVFNTTLNSRIDGNDLQVDYDVNAIINSLKNLFNTKPGQRFLFPLYGLDLNQYVFEAITPDNGRMIGEKISNSIETFEPRVTLLQCKVESDPDQNQYDITIIVYIPLFNTTSSLNSTLDVKTQTFIFVETSRNK